MSIIGFNFTKMHVERTGGAQGKINISNNVGIRDVKEARINLGGSDTAGISFEFAFKVTYEPGIGSIEFEGDVVAMEEKSKVEDILASWKDKKVVPQEMLKQVLDTVLNRCNVQAVVMSRDINLPIPIPMPKVNVKKNSAESTPQTKEAKKE